MYTNNGYQNDESQFSNNPSEEPPNYSNNDYNKQNRMLQFMSDGMQFHKSEIQAYENLSKLHERIEYCITLIDKYNLNPECNPIIWENFEMTGQTIFLTSLDYRKRNKFREAIQGINTVMCFVSSNICFMTDCFVERAECFLSLKLFDRCLSSLMLSQSLGNIYSIKLLGRIKSMEVAARKGCENLKWQIPRPITPSQYVAGPVFHCKSKSRKVPFVDKCIELIVDGAGVAVGLKSNSDLDVGDIIIMESGLIETLEIAQSHLRCEYCFKENEQDLIPCRSCTSAMYCADSNCMMNAWESYHKYECPIMDLICFFDPFRVITRLIITTFRTHEDIEDFIEFTNLPDYKLFNPFTMDWTNRPRNFAAKLLYTIDLRDSFQTNAAKFSLARMTAFLVCLLGVRTKFIVDHFNSPQRVQFLSEFIYHQLFVTMTFTKCQFSNSTMQFTNEFPVFSLIARSINVFQAILRHSAVANTAMTSWGLHRSVIYVQRSVKKGDELTIDYTLYYGVQNKPSSLPPDCPRITMNPITQFFSDHTRYHIEDPTNSITTNVLDKMPLLILLNTETVFKIMDLVIDFIAENQYKPIYMEFYNHLRILYGCNQRLYGMPILYDFSIDGIYNVKYSEWTYANKRLASILKQYKKKYGPSDEIQNQLREYISLTLIPRIDSYIAANALLSIFEEPSLKNPKDQTPIEYFEQFGQPLPGAAVAKYQIVEAFQRLDNIFPTMNYENDNLTYNSSDDESEIIVNFREYIGLVNNTDETNTAKIKKKLKKRNRFKHR